MLPLLLFSNLLFLICGLCGSAWDSHNNNIKKLMELLSDLIAASESIGKWNGSRFGTHEIV